MVGWSFFFIAKSILYFKGNLQYDWFLNSLVGFYSILPWAVTRSVGLEIKKGTAVRVIHSAFGFPLAAMLLWHDSYLPPVKSLTKFLSDPVTRPSNDYLLQFLVSYWNPLEVILLAGILIACVVLAKKRVNLVPGAAAVFFITTAHGAIKIKQNQNDLSLQDLSLPVLVSRPIELEQPKKADQLFDIVILQVCSMS